jgi:hypothetical protein
MKPDWKLIVSLLLPALYGETNDAIQLGDQLLCLTERSACHLCACVVELVEVVLAVVAPAPGAPLTAHAGAAYPTH